MSELIDRDAAKKMLLDYTDSVDRTRTLYGVIGAIVRDIPTVEAVPLAWFNKMIHACGTHGNIDAVRALRWVMGAWKMTEEIWEDEKEGVFDVRETDKEG